MKSLMRSRLARLKLRQEAEKQRMAMRDTRQQLFEELSEEEQEAITTAFARAEGETPERPGLLDEKGLLQACWELGVGGTTFEERIEVKRICDEMGDTVDMYEFSADVVPAARARLAEMLSRELLRQFSFYDTRGTGFASLGECLSIARSVGLDTDTVDRCITNPAAGRAWSKGCNPANVPFDIFHAVIAHCRERLQRVLRSYEVEVKNQMNVDEELFHKFRGDIILLNDLYHEYDMDGSSKLSISEITFMLRDFGLTSKDPAERNMVQQFLDRADEDFDGQFDFLEFLNVIQSIRGMLQDTKNDERLAIFNAYDKDHSGALSIAEISNLLSQLGVAPQTRAEQEELAELILLADDDGSGSIAFDEFQDLCQHIEEKLNRLRFDEEMDIGIGLGFTAVQVRDFRYLFDELDVNGSQTLDLTEVHTGLKILGKPVSQTRIHKMFLKLNNDSYFANEWVEFPQFLGLMALLRDSSTFFEQDAMEKQEVTTPKALDVRTMRRALARLKMPKQYLATFSRDQLMERICKHLRCRPGTLFHQQLNISSVSELYARFTLV